MPIRGVTVDRWPWWRSITSEAGGSSIPASLDQHRGRILLNPTDRSAAELTLPVSNYYLYIHQAENSHCETGTYVLFNFFPMEWLISGEHFGEVCEAATCWRERRSCPCSQPRCSELHTLGWWRDEVTLEYVSTEPARACTRSIICKSCPLLSTKKKEKKKRGFNLKGVGGTCESNS